MNCCLSDGGDKNINSWNILSMRLMRWTHSSTSSGTSDLSNYWRAFCSSSFPVKASWLNSLSSGLHQSKQLPNAASINKAKHLQTEENKHKSERDGFSSRLAVRCWRSVCAAQLGTNLKARLVMHLVVQDRRRRHLKEPSRHSRAAESRPRMTETEWKCPFQWQRGAQSGPRNNAGRQVDSFGVVQPSNLI